MVLEQRVEMSWEEIFNELQVALRLAKLGGGLTRSSRVHVTYIATGPHLDEHQFCTSLRAATRP